MKGEGEMKVEELVKKITKDMKKIGVGRSIFAMCLRMFTLERILVEKGIISEKDIEEINEIAAEACYIIEKGGENGDEMD